MLLQRWTNYIDNGHGGNVELKHIVDTKGFDYVKENFQYSVLENYNARMNDNYILSRENGGKIPFAQNNLDIIKTNLSDYIIHFSQLTLVQVWCII